MRTLKRLTPFQQLAALAAAMWFIAMFGLAGSLSAPTPAGWVGRAGSITIVAAVILNCRGFDDFAAAGRPDELPRITRVLLALGIVEIVAGFALGTIGF